MPKKRKKSIFIPTKEDIDLIDVIYYHIIVKRAMSPETRVYRDRKKEGKTMKKRAVVCSSLALILIAGAVTFFACGGRSPDEYKQYWDTVQMRYSGMNGAIIKKRTDASELGIRYSSTGEGGVRIEADAPGDRGGVVATSVITSKAKTPLDGLHVVVTPEDFTFTRDQYGRSMVISVLWSVDPLSDAGEFDHFDHPATNGIRNLAAPAKGLCVTVNNSYPLYDGTLSASNLMITMIDGDFIDASDGRLGYRWSFTARNKLSQSPNSDGTGIIRQFENVDITNGLDVAVRADDAHGYVVTVNGTDYCSASRIAYYPNNVADWVSPESMTSERGDVDLTPLVGAGDGYVSVGVCGSCDREVGYSVAVSEINGKPASSWNG